MGQLALIILGALLCCGGILNLSAKPGPNPRRKTSKGVAIAMIIVGLLSVGFAFFALPLMLGI
ncbi:MAG TPA: hypothetical protein VFE47_04070 [Tepidisphaeraceae bacterium]|jgi:hypothetical protein|nr:hypothetical protein [Tepidisphaeraceae bacterium]